MIELIKLRTVSISLANIQIMSYIDQEGVLNLLPINAIYRPAPTRPLILTLNCFCSTRITSTKQLMQMHATVLVLQSTRPSKQLGTNGVVEASKLLRIIGQMNVDPTSFSSCSMKTSSICVQRS